MPIHQSVRDQIKEALVAKDQVRLMTLRGLLSAFMSEVMAKKRKPQEELSDEEAMEVILRSIKQRKDSIEQFEKGGRQELADSEKAELVVLETFLPPQMSSEEIESYIKNKQTELGLTDPAKKNQLMGMVMKDLKGKADSAVIKSKIDSLFS